ncbi:AI-2E family transporter [Undibacterium sp. TC4M20W]|uniref:AI-2E family transporter n=1 Tax=Undibacterium sp. TC4M20W TaxID=3413052 RepID=UPI003BF07A09
MKQYPENFAQKPPSSQPKKTIRIELARSTIVAIVGVVLGFALLSQLVPVILVLITALMLVGTLNPAVDWLERRNIRRFAGIAIVFTVLMVVLVGLAVFTVPPFIAQVASLVQQEPELRGHLIKFLAQYPFTASLADGLRHIQYAALFKSYSSEAMAFSRGLFEIIAYGAGAFFLALYIMIDRDRLRGALFAVIPRAHHIKLARIMLNLETIVGGYVRGQVLTCAMMTVFLFILLTACGVPNAIAIAAFGGIVDVLPFVGIFLTMVPAVLAAFAVSGVAATVVGVLLLCYEEFESRVLIPVVYGRALRLPSSIVLFALIAGGTLYGIGGALLALPVAATLLMLIDELKVELPGESLQAKDLAVQRDDIVGEAEYLRRTDGMPAEAAAGIALEISGDRKHSEGDRAAKDFIPPEDAVQNT